MRACGDEILQVPISVLDVDEGGEICNHRCMIKHLNQIPPIKYPNHWSIYASNT